MSEQKKEGFSNRIGDLLNGRYNDILIKKGYLSEDKRETTLTAQELIDIIKRKMGVNKGSKQSITDWQQGTSPKLNVVIHIADLLDVSIDWLVGKDKTPSIQEEADYKPFMRMGFSTKTYEVLKQHKNYYEEIHNKFDGGNSQDIPEDFMVNKGYMNVLNFIIENMEKDGDQIKLPILDGLDRYLNVEAHDNFYKIRELDVQMLSVFNPAVSFVMEDKDSYNAPFTAEEIEEYIEYYNDNCQEGSEIDINSFVADNDENCSTYIKTKRISDRIMTRFLKSANISTIEDIDTDALFFLKTQMVNAKVKQIENILDAERQLIKSMIKEEGLSKKEIEKRVEDELDNAPKYAHLKSLLKFYRS